MSELNNNPEPLVTGQILDGRYLLGGLIGRGGMGVVYRARQLSLDREVAVKFLPPEASEHPELIARFKRELDLAQSFNHPNVAQVYDGGETDGSLYMVMELLRGQDLKAYLADGKILSLGEAIELLLPVCDAIAEAHRRDIVHRDLKPSNIFVCDDRTSARVKVLDFGIAKSLTTAEHDLTKTGQITGTPSYMAPEVVLKRKGKKPCDVYSLGLIFLELILGRNVFKSGTVRDTLIRQLQMPIPIPPPYAGTDVQEFVRACTEKSPANRLPDGAAVVRALRDLQRTMPDDMVAEPEAVEEAYASWSGSIPSTRDSDEDTLSSATTLVANPPSAPPSPGPAQWVRSLPPAAIATAVGVLIGLAIAAVVGLIFLVTR